MPIGWPSQPRTANAFPSGTSSPHRNHRAGAQARYRHATDRTVWVSSRFPLDCHRVNRRSCAVAPPRGLAGSLPISPRRENRGGLPVLCQNPVQGLTCCFTLGARAHSPHLPVHGPGVRLAGAAGAQ
jgi:hypothetical protein